MNPDDASTSRGRRVLMIVDAAPPDYGGAGAQAALLASQLEKEHAVSVQILSRRKSRSFKGRHQNVHIIGPYISNDSISSLAFAAACGFWVLFSRADVIHIHGAFYYGVTASLAARIRRIPIIVKITLLGKDDPASVRVWRKWRLPIGRLVFKQYVAADRVIALNAECRDAAASQIVASKISLIPNGVEAPAEVRDRSLDAAPRVIFVGEFGERKGGDTLLQAWASFSLRHPDAILNIVGPVSYDLGSLDFDVPASVRFRGLVERDKLRHLLDESNLFVLPSRAEGLPNAAIEAMSFGLPVVLSDIPVNLSTALSAASYFTVGSPMELDQALEAAWSNRRELGKLSKERSQFFSISRIASEYAAMYKKLGRSIS